MKKYAVNISLFFLLFYIFNLFSNISAQDKKANKEEALRLVDSVRNVLQEISGKYIPSINIMVTTPEDEIFVSSVPTGGFAITPDTYFRFASNTKNMVAAAVLNMYEDGWLNIYDTITKYIPNSDITYVPEIPAWNIPFKNSITIEKLLQHAAGVYDILNDSVPSCNGTGYVDYILSLDPNHQFTSSELVNQLTLHNLYYFAPGEGYHYSNTGYTILSEIIARVYSFRSGSAKIFSDYMYDYLFGASAPVPLGFKFPYLASDQYPPVPYATSITYNPDTTISETIANMSAGVAEGNGCGTLRMLNTYIRTLMKGKNILTPESVNLMRTNVSASNFKYGLGCTFFPDFGYGHTGATHGYISFMFYDEKTDVSAVGMMPVYELSKGFDSFKFAIEQLFSAGTCVKKLMGY
ncbi:MAG: serine hydrolase domain-containing protein [Ignavibacteria bacterium]